MIQMNLQKETHRIREELMLTRGKKIEGGIDWEFGVDMYTSLYLKQIANKGLIYSTRSSAPYSVIT